MSHLYKTIYSAAANYVNLGLQFLLYSNVNNCVVAFALHLNWNRMTGYYSNGLVLRQTKRIIAVLAP